MAEKIRWNKEEDNLLLEVVESLKPWHEPRGADAHRYWTAVAEKFNRYQSRRKASFKAVRMRWERIAKPVWVAESTLNPRRRAPAKNSTIVNVTHSFHIGRPLALRLRENREQEARWKINVSKVCREAISAALDDVARRKRQELSVRKQLQNLVDSGLDLRALKDVLNSMEEMP